MKIFYTVILLICSNAFMTFAWYGNLKLQQMNILKEGFPLFLIILMSWGVALFEYVFMIPANRIGSDMNGGPLSLVQLKVIQEVISCTVFAVIVTTVFKGQSLQWNHFVAFIFLILAVYFVFLK